MCITNIKYKFSYFKMNLAFSKNIFLLGWFKIVSNVIFIGRDSQNDEDYSA
ncbi:MAG: hypothetical protein JWP44_2305 [Mucilaginibacter sp.]|nr:hypothetical protein [Mucilaginibacter sp.]